MTKAGERLLEAASEALAVARGEEPMASVTIAGHTYYPKPEWQTIDTAPKVDWALGERPTKALLYGPRIGIRDGEIGNFRGHPFGNVSNLHGNAVEDWGVTHWMPRATYPSPSSWSASS